jgi:hypothetical protein
MRAAAAVIAGTLALGAGAAGARASVATEKPWATVNVCDTKAHPDAFGVRGYMRGLGGKRRTHMYLRIQGEFQTGNGTWRSLGAAGDSGWLDAGKSLARPRQTGRTFTITPPAQGQPAYVLRATVTFEWRRGTKVLRHVQVVTTGGHRGVSGADPAGFSAATCSIT